MLDRATWDDAAIFVSGYLRRKMEAVYDHALRSEAAIPLLSADKSVRYAAEAGLCLMLVYMEHAMPDCHPLEKLAKEVLMDAPPEISRRLLNGFREQVLAERQLGNLPDHVLLDTLLDSDAVEDLAETLRKLLSMDPEERIRFIRTSEESWERAAGSPLPLDMIETRSVDKEGTMNRIRELRQQVKARIAHVQNMQDKGNTR